jgi:hypothetical protein
MRTTTRMLSVSIALVASALVGCGPQTPSPPQPAQPIAETFREFQNYEVHFNALRTDTLPAEVAKSYGIQRSGNRVMLNVTVLRKTGEQQPRHPVESAVNVDAYNLTGQLKGMEMRRISEGEAIYYIGEANISGNEILVFDITVTPTGENTPLNVKFKREFHAS